MIYQLSYIYYEQVFMPIYVKNLYRAGVHELIKCRAKINTIYYQWLTQQIQRTSWTQQNKSEWYSFPQVSSIE